jgi:hypothetical protein
LKRWMREAISGQMLRDGGSDEKVRAMLAQ